MSLNFWYRVGDYEFEVLEFKEDQSNSGGKGSEDDVVITGMYFINDSFLQKISDYLQAKNYYDQPLAIIGFN